MDPKNSQPSYTENSLEYLNQISPQRPSPASFLNKKALAIVGGVVLILIIVIAVLASQKPAATPSGQTLGYRITGLNELVTFGQSNTINDAGLRKALAETSVIALSSQHQISAYITLPSTDSKTPVPTAESVAQTVADLGKAISSGSFNKSYTAALIAQIEKIEASLLEIRQAESTTAVTAAKIDADLAQYRALVERLTDY
jgi:hypothetical protein